MVECVCINDDNRPAVIPVEKWVKVGEPYTILLTTLVLPQRQLGAHLAEIELGVKELPYEYFLLSRFSFTEENLFKLIELIQECNATHFNMDELMKQTQLQEELI